MESWSQADLLTVLLAIQTHFPTVDPLRPDGATQCLGQNGNRLTNTITSSSGSRTEDGYDALNRLTGVDYDDGQTQGYTFDPMGNRLTKSDSVNGNESYSYNSANMLLTRGSGGYTNDANGNTLTGGGRTLTWDGQNRLTQCVKGGVTSSFVYGSDGLRRQSTVGGVTTDFILDGQSVVRSVVSGGATKTYLKGRRGPEYERTGSSNPLWYLYDGMGNVLGTVDGSGTVQQSRKYDVYGAVRALSGGSGTVHKWQGRLGHASEDETALVYMRSRYHDPSLGRFISEDPAFDGKQWYNYCHANPTSAIDPSGELTLGGLLGGDAYGHEFDLAQARMAQAGGRYARAKIRDVLKKWVESTARSLSDDVDDVIYQGNRLKVRMKGSNKNDFDFGADMADKSPKDWHINDWTKDPLDIGHWSSLAGWL